MADNAAFAPTWNQNTTILYPRDSNYPVSKRRRVESVCEADWSAQRDTATTPFVFDSVDGSSFIHLQKQNSFRFHGKQQSPVSDGSVNYIEPGASPWKGTRNGTCQPSNTADPYVFSAANLGSYATSIAPQPLDFLANPHKVTVVESRYPPTGAAEELSLIHIS